ncbi:MAG: hypothetical protein JXR80_06045 [Deltaproteobacteria bacterium]|nr:hypothetical protein [Deltaproteobacteria bacterium]
MEEKGTDLFTPSDGLTRALDGFTPDQDANVHLYWEPDGSHGWFKEFHLIENEFRIVDKGEDWIVLGLLLL